MKVMTEELKYIDIDPTAAGKLAQQLHIKKEEIPFIKKSYLADKQEGNAKERSVVSYISTGVKDRDNEALLPGGVKLENYRKNPVVMWAHDYHELPVGKNLWIKTDENGLMAKTVFAKSKRGEELFKAYTEDIDGTGPLLKGWSVGFVPSKWETPEEKELEKDDSLPRRVFTEWELLEYSAVPIPSCPEALTLAVEKNLIPEFLKKDLEGKAFIEEEKEMKGVTAVWREDKDSDYMVDDDGNVITKLETTEKGKELTLEEFKKQIVADHMKGLELMISEAEEKEGRVLSGRNRALLSAVIKAIEDAIPPLKDLLTATEPDEMGERQFEVERDVPSGVFKTEEEVKTEEKKLEKKFEVALIKAIPKVLEKVLGEKLELEFNKLQGKVK